MSKAKEAGAVLGEGIAKAKDAAASGAAAAATTKVKEAGAAGAGLASGAAKAKEAGATGAAAATGATGASVGGISAGLGSLGGIVTGGAVLLTVNEWVNKGFQQLDRWQTREDEKQKFLQKHKTDKLEFAKRKFEAQLKLEYYRTTVELQENMIKSMSELASSIAQVDAKKFQTYCETMQMVFDANKAAADRYDKLLYKSLELDDPEKEKRVTQAMNSIKIYDHLELHTTLMEKANKLGLVGNNLVANLCQEMTVKSMELTNTLQRKLASGEF